MFFKKTDRVYKSFFYAAAVEFALVLFLSVTMVIFGEFFSALFGAGSGEALEASLLRMRVSLLLHIIPLTPLPNAIQAFGYPQLQTAVQVVGTLGLRTVWMQVLYGKVLEKSLYHLYICYPISYAIVSLVYALIVVSLFMRYRKDKLKDKI
jgi:Na+-driven multidrug efflux pump